MIYGKETLKKIKEIIEKNYNSLMISLTGIKDLTDEEISQLEAQGIEITNKTSLLELIYYNNVLNELNSTKAPTTVEGMLEQQSTKPTGNAHDAAEEHVNENFRQALDKLKGDMTSRIQGFVRDHNNDYRNDALQNLDRPEDVDSLIKQSSVGKLKQTLKDSAGDASRNFQRIAITETANAMGLGSADRLVIENRDQDLNDVYVYRIPVNDAALCKHCRRFYLDSDGSPAVYRFSSLLKNGTNYGKNTNDWKPVVGATHPNDRESGVLELKPGWKVKPEGGLEFIGQEKWKSYIEEKVRS